MKTIAQRIEELIEREGGYVDHPADRGGPTRYGITEKVARAHGYTGSMAELPIDLARSIYLATYWTDPRFDQIDRIAPHVAGELFDTGVNMGVGAAAKFLQRALRVLTGTAIAVDGAIGTGTIGALSAYLTSRRNQDGEAVLVELLNDEQGERYAQIVEADADQRAFIFGQIRNRVMDRSPSA